MHWVLLAVAIAAEVVATSSLKAADGFRNWTPLAISYAGYMIAFICLSFAFRTINVGVAYAIWSGVGTVLIALVAWVFYGQKLDPWAFAGIALIVAGVIVLNLFSRSLVR